MVLVVSLEPWEWECVFGYQTGYLSKSKNIETAAPRPSRTFPSLQPSSSATILPSSTLSVREEVIEEGEARSGGAGNGARVVVRTFSEGPLCPSSARGAFSPQANLHNHLSASVSHSIATRRKACFDFVPSSARGKPAEHAAGSTSKTSSAPLSSNVGSSARGRMQERQAFLMEEVLTPEGATATQLRSCSSGVTTSFARSEGLDGALVAGFADRCTYEALQLLPLTLPHRLHPAHTNPLDHSSALPVTEKSPPIEFCPSPLRRPTPSHLSSHRALLRCTDSWKRHTARARNG
ncbi:hypothetical protein BDK51DRAFT_38582 [Blyttiomyces helicus]|uniref:Uncharacterized protein n=1 Tax=Blyttiomyces helicus TaxID=388810 RepID=A0A4P9VT96_9FUNG|nr:hypothetical protein BDK51DRAFT_38582 [Blyttiomyces helicus]|eukprot:RKO82731.1 hypothetical protein BDK51DRAFT_38582 [Blyttiomyces helicus]